MTLAANDLISSYRPGERVRALACVVAQHERHNRKGRDEGGARHGRQRTRRTRPQKPRTPQHQENRKEDEQIGARQKRAEPADREPGERRAGAGSQIHVQAVQRQRHPVDRLKLDVRDVLAVKRREREREAADKRPRGRPGDLAHQEKRAEAVEGRAHELHHVVRQHGVARRPDDRRGQRVDTEQMLRPGGHARQRRKRRKVPPRIRQWNHRRVPRQDRGIEQRIAEIAEEVGLRPSAAAFETAPE